MINIMNSYRWPLTNYNIEREDLDALISYFKLRDQILTHDPKVLEFEDKWREWLCVKYSIMVNSGS